MGQAIGDSITLAIGVAVSPIPIIAIILMLLSTRAGTNAMAFSIGWLVGIAGALVVVILASGAIGTTTSTGSPTHGTSTTKLILGVLLLMVGVRHWRKRPAPGEPVALPKWLQSIQQITPGKSGTLGVVLAAINPKNLLLIVGGGLAIASAPASAGGKTVAAVIFVLLAASTVLGPAIAYLLMGDRVKPWLESLNAWLEANNTAVMAVLFLVIGVVLIGKGIGGF